MDEQIHPTLKQPWTTNVRLPRRRECFALQCICNAEIEIAADGRSSARVAAHCCGLSGGANQTHQTKEKIMTQLMTQRDLESLLKVCRLRAKAAKDKTTELAAERRAEFEKQLATIFARDSDEVWKKLNEDADEFEAITNVKIAQRSRELGIPAAFAPRRSSYWAGRHENAGKDRRMELTKVAYRRIESDEKAAKAAIDAASGDIQLRLLADGLETAAAKAFLESMPAPEQLMPVFTVAEIQKQLPSKNA